MPDGTSLTIATWNINSVRLRLPLVERFLKRFRPDVLCLQEIKCPEDLFPAARLQAIGYRHIAVNGQRGYHGVATVSRLPFDAVSRRGFCGVGDARHLATTIRPDGAEAIALHNFYVPAGGDEPDPGLNAKFAHKLAFLDELGAWCATDDMLGAERRIMVGDLNVAPLENDVWSHRQLLRVVSHTPVEVEKLVRAQEAGEWVDIVRERVPPEEKLYTWWSYRARDWRLSNRGRRLDHIWISPLLREIAGETTVVDAARGWARPSDHVPVLARFAMPPRRTDS